MRLEDCFAAGCVDGSQEFALSLFYAPPDPQRLSTASLNERAASYLSFEGARDFRNAATEP